MNALQTMLFFIPFLAWMGVRLGVPTRDFPGGKTAARWVRPALWTCVVAGLLVPQAIPMQEPLRIGIWCLAGGLGGAELVASGRWFGRFMADARVARNEAARTARKKPRK